VPPQKGVAVKDGRGASSGILLRSLRGAGRASGGQILENRIKMAGDCAWFPRHRPLGKVDHMLISTDVRERNNSSPRRALLRLLDRRDRAAALRAWTPNPRHQGPRAQTSDPRAESPKPTPQLLFSTLFPSSRRMLRRRHPAEACVSVSFVRHRLNGYLAHWVPSLFLADSFRMCLECEVLKGMFPWRTGYPLS